MDATRDDLTQNDLPAATPPARWWRRLGPLVLFAAGAATVGLVGFEGKLPQLQPDLGDAAVQIGHDGGGITTTARLATESNATLVADDAADDLDDASIILMEVTAYCPCQKCCGPRASGVTASGVGVDYNGGRFVAADTRILPFGTELQIPGYGSADGEIVEVVDRGGAIKGYRLDVFYPDHATARQWGRQVLPVRVYSPDGRRGD